MYELIIDWKDGKQVYGATISQTKIKCKSKEEAMEKLVIETKGMEVDKYDWRIENIND